MDKSFITEQVEILVRHLEAEPFDAVFVETHARYIAEMARLHRTPAVAISGTLPTVSSSSWGREALSTVLS